MSKLNGSTLNWLWMTYKTEVEEGDYLDTIAIVADSKIVY